MSWTYIPGELLRNPNRKSSTRHYGLVVNKTDAAHTIGPKGERAILISGVHLNENSSSTSTLHLSREAAMTLRDQISEALSDQAYEMEFDCD
ncbi:hypothetical protein DR950_36245 [Kitasatospora xanthocidica]|uniref:Uncharacterized protein n=1 Tax=Kitasatospora xanthocidica TaxID=83382 RepID=A0A373A3Y1_9ACTN|nr:hypothetical protein [Kitasatospora xanthocidica]RGD62484.1 hypothetical protein DR950_36245 [Kitasatospora xanthocidica]